MTDALERLAAKRRQMQELQKQSWNSAMDTLENSKPVEDRVHVTEGKAPSETKSDVSASATIRKNKQTTKNRRRTEVKPRPTAPEKKIDPKPAAKIDLKPMAKKPNPKSTPELTETLLAIASKVRRDREKNVEIDPNKTDGPVVKAEAANPVQNEEAPANVNPFRKTPNMAPAVNEETNDQKQDPEPALNSEPLSNPEPAKEETTEANEHPVVIELPNLDDKPIPRPVETEGEKMRKRNEERDSRQYVRIKHAGEENKPAQKSLSSVKIDKAEEKEKTKKSRKAAIAIGTGCAVVLLGIGAAKVAHNSNSKESAVQSSMTSSKSAAAKTSSSSSSLANATSTSGQTKAGNVKYTDDEKAVIKKLTAEAAATKKPYQITASSIGGGYILGNISYYPADATKQYNDYSITAPSKASKGLTTDKAKKIEAQLKKNLPTINKTIHVKNKKKVSMATFLVGDKTYNTILLYDGKPFGYVQTDKNGRLTNVVTTYYIQKVTSDK